MRRFIFILLSSLILIPCCYANKGLYIFTFSTNSIEKSIGDSIYHLYIKKSETKSLNIIPITISEGKISTSISDFKNKLDSLEYNKLKSDYIIIGIGAIGSAAATISASKTNPEALILISGVGIDGKDLIFRFLASSTYIVDLPNADTHTIRAQIRDELNGSGQKSIIPEEWSELSGYIPANFFMNILCPVYAAYGLSDSIVEWYDNCRGVESLLPQLQYNENVFRVFPNTGYCLRVSQTNCNVPMIGDITPQKIDLINIEALVDIVNWLMKE